MRRIERRFLVAALLAGLAISPPLLAGNSKRACPKISNPDLVLQFPPVGKLTTRNYEQPTHHGVAILCDDHGRLLRRLETPEGVPGSVAARKYDVPGWVSPVLVVTSDRARADGVSVEPMFLTVFEGRLKELLPKLSLDFADAVCLGTASTATDSRPSVTIIESVTGNECFMCWPKRFRVTTYTWNGSKLIRQSKQMTHRKHKDWRSALGELKLSCPAEVLQATAIQD